METLFTGLFIGLLIGGVIGIYMSYHDCKDDFMRGYKQGNDEGWRDCFALIQKLAKERNSNV